KPWRRRHKREHARQGLFEPTWHRDINVNARRRIGALVKANYSRAPKIGAMFGRKAVKAGPQSNQQVALLRGLAADSASQSTHEADVFVGPGACATCCHRGPDRGAKTT